MYSSKKRTIKQYNTIQEQTVTKRNHMLCLALYLTYYMMYGIMELGFPPNALSRGNEVESRHPLPSGDSFAAVPFLF